MSSAEVRAVVEAEVSGDWLRANSQGVDLRRCLVQPLKVACRNTFPKLNGGKPLQLWIVFEDMLPGTEGGYLIVFDDRRRTFGLATWDGHIPVFLGFYGSFLDTLEGM